MNLQNQLEINLRNIIEQAMQHAPPSRALVVFDSDSGLSRMLTEGYKAALPDAALIDFHSTTPEAIRAAMDAMSPGDLVIMVQSSSFRLNEFRFRLELFERKLKVIEHPHVARMPEAEHEIYVDALSYDSNYYRTVGPAIKKRIDAAKQIKVFCEGTELVYEGPFETAKLNIGDYAGMKQIGGQFPIGEVFTEPKDLAKVNGTVKLFAFGNADFEIDVPREPMLAVIKDGIVVDVPNCPPGFRAVLDQISKDEPLCLRELGFGMNRAMTRNRRLTDIGSYERMCGIHLSIGMKHTIYAKPGFSRKHSRYHMDVFVDVTRVEVDGEAVFVDGVYT